MQNITILIISMIIFYGCASTSEAKSGKDTLPQKSTETIVFPKYSGEKTRIAVFPIALTQKTVADFPEYSKELREKSVGFSLWNRITETLYDTKRFTFVEVSEEIVKQIIDQWWLGQSGTVDPSTVLQMGKMKQAEDFIYGEITEFGIDTTNEVKGLVSKKQTIYRVGIHLRYVNGETLEYVPATAVEKADSIEKASELAIRKAVYNLLDRL